MDSVNPVEKQIEDALASGELTPTRGVGEPFENLDADPACWPMSLLRREKATEEFKTSKPTERDGLLRRCRPPT